MLGQLEDPSSFRIHTRAECPKSVFAINSVRSATLGKHKMATICIGDTEKWRIGTTGCTPAFTRPPIVETETSTETSTETVPVEDCDDDIHIRTDIDISNHAVTPLDYLNDDHYRGLIVHKGKDGVRYVRRFMIEYLEAHGYVYDYTNNLYIWNQSIYERTYDNDIVDSMYRVLGKVSDLELTRSQVLDTVAQFQSVRRPDMLNHDGNERSFRLPVADYDGYNIVPFLNGWYNVDTDRLLPPHPGYWYTHMSGATYNPRILQHPVEEVYKNIIPDDQTRTFFFEMLGFIIFSNRLDVPSIFLIYGPGETGKTALQKVIERCAGESNVSHLNLAQISGEFMIEGLIDKTLNVCGETGCGSSSSLSPADGERLKQLSEGQMIMINRKHRTPIPFENQAKLLFVSNSVPYFGDTSSGLQRRLYIIPCRQKQNWEDQIYDKLLEEDAVSWAVNMALRAYLRFDKRGRVFEISDEMKKEHRHYTAIINPIFEFVRDYLDIEDNVFGSAFVEAVRDGLDGKFTHSLYEDFKQWAMSTDTRTSSESKFKEKIHNEFNMEIKTEHVMIGGLRTRRPKFVKHV